MSDNNSDTTENSQPNGLDNIDGTEKETVLLLAGESSMPDDRNDAVQAIDEAVVESPFQPTDEIRYRGLTDHEDAMRVWVNSRNKLDPNVEYDGTKFGIEWPDDDADCRDEDGDIPNEVISELFNERNREMTDGVDAVIIVTSGGDGDYLRNIKQMTSRVDTYDDMVENIDEELAEEALGL
jgi:hypothetical protein